ncbi:MAG: hypothetical protein HC909_04640 [Blastochloris sp.]|nr:hypothetical protein [Blastochloris sp.]
MRPAPRWSSPSTRARHRRTILMALDEPIAADAVAPADTDGPDLAQVVMSGAVLALVAVLPGAAEGAWRPRSMSPAWCCAASRRRQTTA